MTTLTQASTNWATRSADERFLSLNHLNDSMQQIRKCSGQGTIKTNNLVARVSNQLVITLDDQGNEVTTSNQFALELINTSKETETKAYATNYAFGQLAKIAGAPQGYLSRLPSNIASQALNYGLQNSREEVGLLATRNTDDPSNPFTMLRAVTSPSYGRVWNADVTQALVDRFGDGVTGEWTIPGEFKNIQKDDNNNRVITPENTTLYGSDRDMFVFLSDEQHYLELPNRRNGETGKLSRGFFVWNSEVGDNTLGVAFFLYDYMCANHIVWGASGYKEITKRHSKFAPENWLDEVSPILLSYGNQMSSITEQKLISAQNTKIDDTMEFLVKKVGLNVKTANLVKTSYVSAEHRPMETLWDVTTGLTEYAKTIEYRNERLEYERMGGKVLEMAQV